LGLKVTAEGVETREAKDMLVGFKCDEAQGYYYSHPIPAREIVQLFKESPSGKTERAHGAANFSAMTNRGNGRPLSLQALDSGHR
jgi:predicted signal transduction protein with EAL and GGDEF domain